MWQRCAQCRGEARSRRKRRWWRLQAPPQRRVRERRARSAIWVVARRGGDSRARCRQGKWGRAAGAEDGGRVPARMCGAAPDAAWHLEGHVGGLRVHDRLGGVPRANLRHLIYRVRMQSAEGAARAGRVGRQAGNVIEPPPPTEAEQRGALVVSSSTLITLSPVGTLSTPTHAPAASTADPDGERRGGRGGLQRTMDRWVHDASWRSEP